MGRILLVDDDALNRDMLTRRLKKRGFDITVAENGQEACEKAAEQLPDVILMDMNMPVMDGYEATRRIKADERTSRIAVIGLTALAMTGDREKVLEAGCDEYESKPVQLTRLLEKINNLMESADDA